MNLYQQFKTDSNAETGGIDLNYGENSKGQPILIKIARAGGSNKKYQKVIAELSRPHRRSIQSETLPPEKSDALLRKAFARSVVLGWSGVEDAEGKPMDYSEENVEKLFKDLPDLFADVREQANSSALFRAEILETTAKN